VTAKQNRKEKKSEAEKRLARKNETRQWITIVILVAFTVIGLMRAGKVGVLIYNILRYLFGDIFWLILLLIVLWLLISIASEHQDENDERNPLPMVLLILDVELLAAFSHAGEATGMIALTPYLTDIGQYFSTAAADLHLGGGLLGALLYAVFSLLFGRSGCIVMMIAILIIATVLMGFMDAYKNAFSYVMDFFRVPEDDKEEEEEKEEKPKERPNLWKMKEEHKQKRASFINADEPVQKQNLKKVEKQLERGEEVVIRMKPTPIDPSKLHPFDIRVDEDDGDTNNLSLMKDSADLSNEDTLKMQRPLSENENIFINLDDLQDHVKPAEPAVRKTEKDHEDTEQLSGPEPVTTRTVPIQPETPPAPMKEEKKKGKQTSDYSHYRRPDPNKVLDPIPPKTGKNINELNAQKKGEQLIQVLQTFDIPARVRGVHIGPSVTQFEVQPDANVKISRIVGITDNIKMQLEARDIRIEAPIPGKNAVGIEIPNEQSTPVKMKDLISHTNPKDKNRPLLFYLGKDLLGQTITCRIDKMPHLLIAGATGSGKSVCMNSIICSILLRSRPDEVKMLLIDPKKVEFTPYARIPHLIGPVINDPAQASNALQVIVRIMDERYDLFAASGVRNIAGYHELLRKMPPEERKHTADMPYIVVIIDELADLMITAGKEVEASIQRITQLARAAGIHLIVATQRPSTDVITGVIKANIPSRIAFSVSSSTDSRVILDHPGAERLLGNGDMLYLPIGQNSATRVQGVFITDEEVERITEALAPWGPHYDDSFVMLEGAATGEFTGNNGVSDDPLFQEVKDYVIESRKASTSLLQRRFGIGYNRAARMIDELEATGIIGPANGSKPREVFAKKPDHDNDSQD
jgi:S-DNA-T family DNA segregation ATPase FtsK/SpoIIIE